MKPSPVRADPRLIFLPRRDGVTLRWEADVLGARASRMAPPFPRDDLALVLRALDALQDPAYPVAWNDDQERRFAFDAAGRARLAALDLWDAAERVSSDAPRRVGRRLFHALTADPAGARALATLRDHATALGHPLRLELCFPPDATDLAALPWELLWDDGPLPLALAHGGASSIARRLDLPQALPPRRRSSGPLRILAVSPRAGIGPELRQVERAARLDAWQPLIAAGRATVQEVEPASRAAVVQALGAGPPPDIVHFYGHGRYLDGEGALLLDDGPGTAWTPAATLAALFGGVALVVLHACQGAMLGASGPLVAGVAQALCANGVPAVLGMQFSVRASAAGRAGALLYQALAAGRSLQDAVALARRALFVEEGDRVSWFVPALYLRDRDGGPFYVRPPAADPAGESSPPAARQMVLARDGQIRALRIQGRAGSAQRVVALDGGRISGVSMEDRS